MRCFGSGRPPSALGPGWSQSGSSCITTAPAALPPPSRTNRTQISPRPVQTGRRSPPASYKSDAPGPAQVLEYLLSGREPCISEWEEGLSCHEPRALAREERSGFQKDSLRRYLRGRTVVVFNRSEVVGRPLACMLSNDGGTVYSGECPVACARSRARGSVSAMEQWLGAIGCPRGSCSTPCVCLLLKQRCLQWIWRARTSCAGTTSSRRLICLHRRSGAPWVPAPETSFCCRMKEMRELKLLARHRSRPGWSRLETLMCADGRWSRCCGRRALSSPACRMKTGACRLSGCGRRLRTREAHAYVCECALVLCCVDRLRMCTDTLLHTLLR
jgi:hypothetical protein